VEVIVNGKSMGLMGKPGQVVDQVWEKQEATASPQPSVTDTPTLTPGP
jgi:hypothetical protein